MRFNLKKKIVNGWCKMMTTIKQIEKAANRLELNFSKEGEVPIFTSRGEQKIFDIFQFNNREFFICIFNDGYEFALGGSHYMTQLYDLFCPSYKTNEESKIYEYIVDICKSLMKRDSLFRLYIKQGNIDGIRNRLKFFSTNELTSFFNIAAFYGQLDICKLIYEKANYMHASHAMVFACQEGHLDVAKWLYSVGGDPHFKNTQCLRHVLYSITNRSYKESYYDVIDWLCTVIHPYSLKKYSIPRRPILN